eukprot:7745881-Pyramimonas_sp.AAC.1
MPRWPKRHPRRSQAGFPWAPRRPKKALRRPKTAPRRPHDGPQTPTARPAKLPPRWHKRAPNR